MKTAKFTNVNKNGRIYYKNTYISTVRKLELEFEKQILLQKLELFDKK